jgi:hypothetical protein
MKNNKVPGLVALAILTVITAVIWVFFSVYRVFTSKPDTKVASNVIIPLSPDLNQSSISKIENRVFIEDNQIPEQVIENPVPVQIINSPTASPSASPEATGSAQLPNL